MILYFTGTGNSRFVAERTAQATGLGTVDISGYIKSGKKPVFKELETYIFVCPCYMSSPARAMTDLIEEADFPKGIKAYFAVTCASAIGIAPKVFKELSDRKGFEYMGTARVVMPQNYIIFFTTKDKAANQEIVESAIPSIDSFIRSIKDGSKLIDGKIHVGEYTATVMVRDLYYKHFMKTKKFLAGDVCISCGKCVKVCPMGNIELKDGRPVWGKECTHCMACINLCPVDAVEYGKGSAGKPRYKGPIPPGDAG